MKESTAIHLELDWTQPDILERHFELRTIDHLLARLCFETVSDACGTFFKEGSAQESWTFRGEWVHLKPCIIIREIGANENFAIYKPKFLGGGNLEFMYGTTFYWRSMGLLGAESGFFSADNELLLSLNPKPFDLIKVQSKVEINPQSQNMDELPLLLMLGCYLQVSGRNASI